MFYAKNKIEMMVLRRLIINFQSFSDDWPTRDDPLLTGIELTKKKELWTEEILFHCLQSPILI